jgi:hypothetical protein
MTMGYYSSLVCCDPTDLILSCAEVAAILRTARRAGTRPPLCCPLGHALPAIRFGPWRRCPVCAERMAPAEAVHRALVAALRVTAPALRHAA